MRIPLTGGAYTARTLGVAAQRAVNLYAEPLPQAEGEPAQMAHFPTPGLRLVGTVGNGPIRALRQATTGGIYAVSGSTVYSLDASFNETSVGSITAGLHTPVSMQDNTLDLVVCDGTSSGWTVNLASNAFAPISDLGGMFAGADKVEYLDTFLIFNKPRTPQFYWSGSLAVTFDTLDFANKSAYADLLQTIAVAKREIWLLGKQTSEVWYDAGATDIGQGSSQFASVQSVFIDHGCVAKYSAAVYDNAVYWLTQDRAGRGIVLQGAGYQTKRVSTYPIETALAEYERIDDAIGFTYQLGGHAFYVLTFPRADKTWCYDVTTGFWHEWVWLDTNGDEHRSRANCAAVINGEVIVGDHQNGKLYALDLDTYEDDGEPIKRLRTYPHILNDGKRVFYRQFLANFESGEAPSVGVTTETEHIITWPPEIAQLNIPADSVGAVQQVAPDWPRGLIYFGCLAGYRKYTTDLATQSPVLSVAIATNFLSDLAVDPLSGDLLCQRGLTNAEPVLKIDPATFNTLASFGAVTSFPSYPSSVWVGDAIVCVVCNGVSYGLLKESAFSGHVAAFRVDTMQHAGFYQNIVTGSVDNRGTICAGASGGSAASAFASWNAITSPTPTVPLYVINITAGAETYNPASWPTTNPNITWSTVGTIAAASVDPTWSNLTVRTIGYDLADGHVLMQVFTFDAVAQKNYIIKVNSSTAVVMWAVAISATVHLDLERTRINGSLWVVSSGGGSQRIDTSTGTVDSQTLTGVSVQGGSGTFYLKGDSENAIAMYWGTFTVGTDSPIPVSGTGTFTSGWALMGGQTTVVVTTGSADSTNLITLEWSDDRGHTYGQPVLQSIGERGEYLTWCQWQRLGYARDRIFRLSWSVPMKCSLMGAFIDAYPAQS